MRIGVISDTHRISKYIEESKEKICDCDVLIHLVDNTDDVRELTQNFYGEVYTVRGNCDFDIRYPSERIIELDGIKLFITHGDKYGVKYSLTNIYYKGKEIGADIVLFGHTHVSCIEEEDGLILMNPGSVSLPRGTGRSLGIIDIKDGHIKDVFLKHLEI